MIAVVQNSHKRLKENKSQRKWQLVELIICNFLYFSLSFPNILQWEFITSLIILRKLISNWSYMVNFISHSFWALYWPVESNLLNTYLAHTFTWNSSSEIVTVCGALTLTSNLGNTGNTKKQTSVPTITGRKTYCNHGTKEASVHNIGLCMHLYRPRFNCPKFCVSDSVFPFSFLLSELHISFIIIFYIM